MLELSNLSADYGRLRALRRVSLVVKQHEIVSLVGANGAGKSTLMKTISGLLRPADGTLRFDGHDLARATPAEIVRRGISHVPEGRRVFSNLTVQENLELGAYSRPSAEAKEYISTMYGLFPRLQVRRSQLAGFMSGGEQQMLALARALMSRPRLLLLDEPSMGLAPLVAADVFRILRRLNAEFGLTILLVEQNAKSALKIADRGYILKTGEIVHAGSGKELLDDPLVTAAFLGNSRSRRFDTVSPIVVAG